MISPVSIDDNLFVIWTGNMYTSIRINKIENYQGYGCVWLGDYPNSKY